LWIALAAPRGQIWLERRADGGLIADAVSLRPGAAHGVCDGETIAGSGAALLGAGQVLATAPPCAADARWLGAQAAPPVPCYVRPADHVGA
jgi:hypothetical protein